MKRIGGLKQQVGAGVQALTVDGRTPAEQIARVLRARPRARGAPAGDVHGPSSHRARRRTESAIASLRRTRRPTDQKAAPRILLREHLSARDAPDLGSGAPVSVRLEPLAQPAGPLPRSPGARSPSSRASRFRSAPGIPRFLQLDGEQHLRPARDRDDRATSTCSSPARASRSCTLFRVTRNANTERDEENADDLLALIETEMRERQFRADRAARSGSRHVEPAARHARGRARARRADRRLRGRRTCFADARPDGAHAHRRARTPRPALRARRPPGLRSRGPLDLPRHPRGGRRCWSTTRTSRTPRRSSASCARRAATRRCARSR